MKIPNPFRLLLKLLGFIWWPFGWMFGWMIGMVAKNDRCWDWIIKKMQSRGVDVEPMQAARRTLLSEGAEVILPSTVERTPAEQEKTSGEAKP